MRKWAPPTFFIVTTFHHTSFIPHVGMPKQQNALS